MLKIVIIEREPFTLLGIKTAISPAPDIEVTGEATCGEIGFQLINGVPLLGDNPLISLEIFSFQSGESVNLPK